MKNPDVYSVVRGKLGNCSIAKSIFFLDDHIEISRRNLASVYSGDGIAIKCLSS